MNAWSRNILYFFCVIASSTAYGQSHGWPDGKVDYDKLIESIAEIESKGNPDAVSPRGTYVGYLQISRGLVDACNKIAGEQRYNYQDRYDKDKSIEMFLLMQERYNPENDMILAIRMWKEGTSAANKSRTKTAYVNKVLAAYETLPEGGSYYMNTDFSGEEELLLFFDRLDDMASDRDDNFEKIEESL